MEQFKCKSMDTPLPFRNSCPLKNAPNLTPGFKSRKHCQSCLTVNRAEQAGLLTCNVFTILPILLRDQWISQGKNFWRYLQLRDSS